VVIENPSLGPKDEATNVRRQMSYAADQVRRWGKAEPQKAAQWVESLPPGSPRDAAAFAMVEEWRQLDVEEATRWATGWEGMPVREDVQK
jgi:hypothetical protein